MPVPITRTDWRLDRIVTLGTVVENTDPGSGLGDLTAGAWPVYNIIGNGDQVRIHNIRTDLRWWPVAAQGTDALLTLALERFPPPDQGFAETLSGTATAAIPVLIGGGVHWIERFQDVELAKVKDLVPGLIIQSAVAGSAQGQGGGTSASFGAPGDVRSRGSTFPSYNLDPGGAATLYAATVARFLTDPGETGASPGALATVQVSVRDTPSGEAGSITHVLAPGEQHFAQLADRQTQLQGVTLDDDVNVQFATELAEYVTRVEPPAGDQYLIDGDAIYTITGYSPIGRGQYWQLNCERTVRRVVL